MTIRPSWRFGLAAAGLLLGLPAALAQSEAPSSGERPWTDPPSRDGPAQAGPVRPAPTPATPSRPVAPQAEAAPAAAAPAPRATRADTRAVRPKQASRPNRDARRQRLAQPPLRRAPVAVAPSRRRILAEVPPVGRFRDEVRGDRLARIRAAEEAGYLVIRSRTIELPDGRRLRSYAPYEGEDADD